MYVVVLVGLPGAGKSTYAQIYRASEGWVVVCQDELRTLGACDKAVAAAHAEGKHVMIDRCNTSKKQRAHWVEMGARLGVPVVCWVLPTPYEECVRRATTRAEHPTLSVSRAKQVISMMRNRYEPPAEDEGFTEVRVLQ